MLLRKRHVVFIVGLLASSWLLAAFSFVYYRTVYYQLIEGSTSRGHIAGSMTLGLEIFEGVDGVLSLPGPITAGERSLEETLNTRRSKRQFLDKPVSIAQLSQVLWAAQGVTQNMWGLRTAPSAGGTYPLELIVAIGNNSVEGVKAGGFRYEPSTHRLIRVFTGDRRNELAKASLSQPWVEKAPVVIVILAVFERTTQRYGERGIRYVHLEAGHAAQNILLEAVAIGLGGVPVGAFGDDEVKRALETSGLATPLYVIPIGYPTD